MNKRKYRRLKKRRPQNTGKHIYIFLGAILILFLIYFIFASHVKRSLNNKIPGSITTKLKLEPQENVHSGILAAIELLGVPEKKFRVKEEDNLITFRIGIDEDTMDLNFANSIISGQVELSGGKILSGKESVTGLNHYLQYSESQNEKIYEVILYYTNHANKSPLIKLAIVLDDFGYFKGELLEDFCSLDPNITFAILPHLDHSRTVMNLADRSGHETIIHMPMEPLNYPKINPGPKAIYVHDSPNNIKKRVEGYIKNLPLCVGANNHMGSLATADNDVMEAVLSVLKKNGLYFVDSRTSQSSIAYKLAQDMMIPTFENTMYLDTPKISDEVLQIKIDRLKKLIKTRDKILIISHCTSRELYVFLTDFLERISELDVELVPVSELFKSDLPDIL